MLIFCISLFFDDISQGEIDRVDFLMHDYHELKSSKGAVLFLDSVISDNIKNSSLNRRWFSDVIHFMGWFFALPVILSQLFIHLLPGNTAY